MGFHVKWVNLMMMCITTVSYSLLINGEPSEKITPSRGIRQGDPISPYLFLLCSEGLHALIENAAQTGLIRGISICRNGPRLTHLFFADDSLIFCKASIQECIHIQSILSEYEAASGQKLNREKTTLFFSKATSSSTQENIINLLGVSEVKQYEKYLGLPSFVGRGKRASFAFIKERVWSKLMGWKEKLLSQAGREVLIKAVIQALPSFAMSYFKLPSTLCHEIEVMFVNASGGSVAKNNLGSFAWKSILRGRDIISRGAKWGVGNGWNIKIFDDKWLPSGGSGRVTSPPGIHDPELRVASLIDHDLHCWKSDRVDAIFSPAEARVIKAIPLSFLDSPDWLYWPWNRSGVYSVKTGYNLAREWESLNAPSAPAQTVCNNTWKKIWNLHVPNRICTLLWRASNDSLPTKVNLTRRKMLQVDTCPNCNLELETVVHALWSCKKLDIVWLPKFAKLKEVSSSLSCFSNLMYLALQDPICVEESGPCLGARIPAYSANPCKNPKNYPCGSLEAATPGLVKVNFNGAIFSTHSSAGLGVIIRDQAGLVLAALSQNIPLPTSVEAVEVMAARRALLFAKELGFERVVVEGDSEVVIKAIKEKSLLSSGWGHLLKDIHALSHSFSCIYFLHVKRLGNRVAHSLARRSFCNPLLVWMEELPLDIVDVYNQDLGFINE
ncbi:uncharacterized protein LOC115961274 [Quercus lobata]|uniref:uncharacterized protein LOC115961274 n=1 Tax=Quercus lobata TaxID=97700 RepID=UPI001246AFDB|nr:uncharacterized protein LOC115961274 [Quercus lobata]